MPLKPTFSALRKPKLPCEEGKKFPGGDSPGSNTGPAAVKPRAWTPDAVCARCLHQVLYEWNGLGLLDGKIVIDERAAITYI